MTAAQIFAIANPFALFGWAVLAAAIVLKRPWLRDVIAGTIWPLALAVLYVVALALGWGTTGGNFSSLAGVRQLFSGDWTLLAGWVHYLAFDLFIGAWIAAEAERAGLSRLWLIPVLPLTFLFGPAGFLLFFVIRRPLAGRTS
jgi:hypothetical protein